MLNDKRIKEINNRINRFMREGIIKTKENVEFVDFFQNHSRNFLNSAKAEYLLSTDEEKSKRLGFIDYNGLIVVVNSSYYSMFHMARALLEKEGIKIKSEFSVHSITYDALTYFFYLSKKMEKGLIDSYAIAKEESAEISGKERATEMINDYLYEKRKRSAFTYQMGSELVKAKAKTSLDRATRFYGELKRLFSI